MVGRINSCSLHQREPRLCWSILRSRLEAAGLPGGVADVRGYCLPRRPPPRRLAAPVATRSRSAEPSAPTAALSTNANHASVGVSSDHDWRPQDSPAVLPMSEGIACRASIRRGACRRQSRRGAALQQRYFPPTVPRNCWSIFRSRLEAEGLPAVLPMSEGIAYRGSLRRAPAATQRGVPKRQHWRVRQQPLVNP